eukprot:Skav236656  [mRNA]  locus=scaffold3354:4255:4770:+ [translate_table: standard]
MVNYQNGQIYKIVDVGFNKCYIGSTCENLKRRFQRHKDHHIEYQNGKRNLTTSSLMFNEYGVENCKIVWIKDYPCNSKKELEAEEGRIQSETDCVNKYVAGRSGFQWRIDNEEHLKEYYKQYAQKNKERIKTKKNQIFNCECGSTYTYGHKTRHFKTDKHQQYLQTQNNTD